jgi:hypothetical protein
MLMKLAAMRAPETLNVHPLCRDSETNHGSDESAEATVAPRPRRTRTDGNAQHRSVLNDVKSEK